MDTRTIAHILTGKKQTQRYFKGVFPRDEFASRFSAKKRGVWVFNTDKSTEKGEHWISVSTMSGDIEYFDSYGTYPSLFPLVNAALRIKKRPSQRVIVNRRRVQGFTSTVCGDYCIIFCLMSIKGWSMRHFVNKLLLIKHDEIRDHLVRKMMTNVYGTFYPNNLEGKDGVHIPGMNVDL